MDTVFFIASKIVWALLSPASLIVMLGVSAWIALAAGWQKLSRRLLAICALLLLVIGFLPVGEWAIAPLEKRFLTNPALPQSVDGIVVLGGFISPQLSQAWMQAELGGAADRLTNFLYLAELYPSAQLVFTGGSGSLSRQEQKEAEPARLLFDQLGLAERAIIYESASRNTQENVANTKILLNPAADQNWLLVTSAFHMPRAIGVFCEQQWPIQPYPVDHYSRTGDLLRIEFAFAAHLSVLNTALKEWLGLIAYRISGKTSQFLSSQQDYCGA